MPSTPDTRNTPDASDPGAYLRALNQAFPGWGGPAEFAWWFRRAVGGPLADLLFLGPADAPFAGMAVTYRRLLDPAGDEHLVGVLTGAWTASGHQRHGCADELFVQCQHVAAQRGAAALLAFVGRERVTAGALERRSVGAVPAWSLTVPGGGGPGADLKSAAPSAIELHRYFQDHRGSGGMRYPTVAIFTEQARLGAPDTAVVGVGEDAWAIVGSPAGRRTVAALVHADGAVDPERFASGLKRAAQAAGSLHAYTTDADVARAATAGGASATAAGVYMLALAGEVDHWLAARWAFQALDKA